MSPWMETSSVRLKGSDGTDVAQSLIKTNIVAKAPVQGWKKISFTLRT